MPISRTSFLRYGILLLAIGLGSLIAIVAMTIWLAERTQTSFEEVIEARNARTVVVNLRNVLQVAETSQRGYLLTGDESFLDDFERARSLFEPYYEEFRTGLENYSAATFDYGFLKAGLDEKEREMLRTIELARSGDRDGAFALVRTNHGRELMEQANNLFSGIIGSADTRLMTGVEAQNTNAALLRWATIVGGLVILVVVGGAVWMGVAYTRELMRAQAEIHAMNVGLEVRVDERTRDLRRANEEVQRFAYIVTHDLRAPLVNIMGFTSEVDTAMKAIQRFFQAEPDERDQQTVAEASTAAREDLPEAIGFIRSSTRKMDGLINAILKISRDGRRPLKPDRIDLKALLETNLATVQHQIQEQGGAADLDVGVDTVVSDRLSLEQIVGNLLDNAVKYSSPDRPIHLSLKARKSSGRVRIEVADNGRGIAPEDHQRVFDLFRRAGTQDKPGEGIGLAHVRTLARSLGGDISVSSEANVGSTFTVDLPADLRSFVRSEQS